MYRNIIRRIAGIDEEIESINITEYFKEMDSEDRKDALEGFIGFASLFAIVFMLSGIGA